MLVSMLKIKAIQISIEKAVADRYENYESTQETYIDWFKRILARGPMPHPIAVRLARSFDYLGPLSNLVNYADIRALKRECEVYELIEEYARNGSSARGVNWQVRQIFKVERRNVPAPPIEPSIFLWKGLRLARLQEIIQEGFQLGSHISHFGGAVNFHDRIAKSGMYAQKNSSNRCVFALAKIYPGITYTCPFGVKHDHVPQGYSTFLDTGKTVPDPLPNKFLYGAKFPSGVNLIDPNPTNKAFSSYMVADPNRIFLTFIVECEGI